MKEVAAKIDGEVNMKSVSEAEANVGVYRGDKVEIEAGKEAGVQV